MSTDVIEDPDLWAALGTLSRGERAALILHVIEGYTYDEIAQKLGVSVGTVGSWLSRGKARMRANLEGEDDHGRLRSGPPTQTEPVGDDAR